MSTLESAARILAYYAAVELIENKKYGGLGTYDENDTFWALSDALAHMAATETHEPLVEMSDDRAREVISGVMRSTTDGTVRRRLAAILTVLDEELIRDGRAYVTDHDAFVHLGGVFVSIIQDYAIKQIGKPSKRHAPVMIYG